MVYIIARSFNEAKHYAMIENLQHLDWVYVCKQTQVLGRSRDICIVMYRPNTKCQDLADTLKGLGYRIKVVIGM